MRRFTTLFKLTGFILAGFHLTGCATASRGTNDKLAVSTFPAAAIVTTDKETLESKKGRKNSPDLTPTYYGCPATPCEFKVPRRSEFIMTISKDGYEDVEIGIDNGLSKSSLNANLSGSAGVGVATGVTIGALAATFTSALGGAGAAGAGATAGAVSAAAVALPLFVVSTAIDGASGALLNVRPNPIILTLPPEGTKFKPHPKVQEIRNKRAGIVVPRRKRNQFAANAKKQCSRKYPEKLRKKQERADKVSKCVDQIIEQEETALIEKKKAEWLERDKTK